MAEDHNLDALIAQKDAVQARLEALGTPETDTEEQKKLRSLLEQQLDTLTDREEVIRSGRVSRVLADKRFKELRRRGELPTLKKRHPGCDVLTGLCRKRDQTEKDDNSPEQVDRFVDRLWLSHLMYPTVPIVSCAALFDVEFPF